MREFKEVQRFDGLTWVRDCGTVFIVHYEEVLGHHSEMFIVYRAIERVPAGRNPWSVNNVRCGTYGTLQAAKTAASDI
jgi:hypothetical protein